MAAHQNKLHVPSCRGADHPRSLEDLRGLGILDAHDFHVHDVIVPRLPGPNGDGDNGVGLIGVQLQGDLLQH